MIGGREATTLRHLQRVVRLADRLNQEALVGIARHDRRAIDPVNINVWVSNEPKDTVSRLDSKTNTVTATISVGKKPCSGLAAEFGSLWVPNCGDQTISRVDLKTGAIAATIRTGVGQS